MVSHCGVNIVVGGSIPSQSARVYVRYRVGVPYQVLFSALSGSELSGLLASAQPGLCPYRTVGDRIAFGEIVDRGALKFEIIIIM